MKSLGDKLVSDEELDRITFDKDTAEFVVEDSQQVEIKRLKPKGLTVEEITSLHLVPRQGSPG